MAKPRISRRKALGIIGGGSAVGLGLAAGREILFDPAGNQAARPDDHAHHPPAAPATTASPTTEAPPARALWSDPATWGGVVPGPGDVAVVDRAVLLDVDAQVAGVQIRPEGELVYEPAVGHTLTSTGNVVVEGALRLRPDAATVQHVLSFSGIDESAFVGDHSDAPLDTDVGLWVLGTGVLDLLGSEKTAWTHLAAEVGAGTTTITVDDAAGWQLLDEVVITPTESATVDGHWEHHDRRVVTALAGNQVTLDRPLDHPHPFVPIRDGVTQRPEVLNLGRNVRIEGAPEARSHVILLHAHSPQALGWFGLRHMGPRQGESNVLGRYALHFHMCDDGVDGSTVVGGVATDCGNHAFVTHLSNGVTLQDCVTHDTIEDPFWWDLGTSLESPRSHRVTYDRCVASYVRSGTTPHTTSGFLVGAGRGNTARGCVATGIEGDALAASGFRWDQNSGSGDIWIFEDNLTHNNNHSGIYFWQNNAPRTIIDRFTAYHCRFGITAGAYINIVSYRDTTVYACSERALVVDATNGRIGSEPDLTYEGMHVDQAGLTEFAVEINRPTLEGEAPTPVTGCTFRGGTTAQVLLSGGELPHKYDFRDCRFEGNAFWLDDGVRAASQIRVADGVNGTILLSPLGAGGTDRPEWNAAVAPG